MEVGAADGEAVVGREQHRFVEPGEVGDEPRAHHRERGDAREQEQPELAFERELMQEQRDREHHEREEQAELGACEHGETARGTQPQRRGRARRADEAVGQQDRQRDREGRERLRHHQAVVDPEVRVERGDRRRHQPGAVAGDGTADEPDQEHHTGAEQRHGEPLRQQVPTARVEALPSPTRSA